MSPSSYPAGYAPGRLVPVEFRCPNEDCELHGEAFTLEGSEEFGRTFLRAEGEGCCPECDSERESV